MLASGEVIIQPVPSEDALDSLGVLNIPLVRVDRASRVVDTLFAVPMGHPLIRLGSGGVYIYSPFDDSGLWQAAPDGSSVTLLLRPIATSETVGAFVVKRVSAEGSRQFERSISYRPIPISSEMIDSVVQVGARRLRDRRLGGFDIPRMIREGLFIPRYLPPVVSLVAGRDGTTWVERERIRPGTASWLVLDATGLPIAELSLPAHFRVFQADRTALWGFEEENGVLRVVRYMIRGTRR